jgi:hypothetical protein
VNPLIKSHERIVGFVEGIGNRIRHQQHRVAKESYPGADRMSFGMALLEDVRETPKSRLTYHTLGHGAVARGLATLYPRI